MTGLPSFSDALLLPEATRGVVEDVQIDANGHMNVLHYFDILTTGTWGASSEHLLGPAYPIRTGQGLFAVEHYVQYRWELRLNAEFSTHNRVLECARRSFHDIVYLVDRTSERVAGALEAVWVNVDLHTRRAAPFGPRVMAAIRERAAVSERLAWKADGLRLTLRADES